MTPMQMQSPPAARTLINDRWCDYFSGTGYLGLQGHPVLTQAAVDAIQRYGLTTATSRGGYGEHPAYQAVEQAAANFFGTEQAVYFTSGLSWRRDPPARSARFLRCHFRRRRCPFQHLERRPIDRRAGYTFPAHAAGRLSRSGSASICGPVKGRW